MSTQITPDQATRFQYGDEWLTTGKALAIARGHIQGVFNHQVLKRIDISRNHIDQILARNETVYGINTGFGPLCNTLISAEETIGLQHNILKSHSVGVGDPIPIETTRLMLLLKIHALAQGFSGVSQITLDRLVWHLQNEVIPVVPAQGSVGASGDLAPLAHLCLPLIGLGQVYFQNQRLPAAQVLSKFRLRPVVLGPKEGLALINGTQFMVAFAIQIIDRLQNCLTHADIIGAMTLEALLGSAKPFKPEVHALRPHRGCRYVARRMQKLLENSEIMQSHAHCGRVQDPYSLRCIPQVHGTSRNAWLHLKEITETEINSVTDNPVILESGEAVSGGNFHGQPLALPLDYAGLAAAEIGNIADRRIYLMLEGNTEGLPKLLMKNTGLNSGFMLPQYTTAALVSENKSLCFPASADSVPTSLGQEDHVSMGAISGRKSLQIVENLEKILAIELLCASQAFDFRRPHRSSTILEECHAHIRTLIDHADHDRVFANDIATALEIIQSRRLKTISDHYLKQDDEITGSNDYSLFEVY
jgi:histidine ammonia-lyase